MEDSSTGAGKQAAAAVSRPELYEDYVKCCVEVGPCRDQDLLQRAAQYLLSDDPIPAHTFTLFPFHRALSGAPGPLGPHDLRRHLTAFIRATELLETLCVNLLLQPWRKEIKTLKTFTGPFVYFLLPVLSRSTIHSVLASIGYLPHTHNPQSLMSVSEFRLCEAAQTNSASLMGFELLLARLECFHLLELLDQDQLDLQQWLELLQRRTLSSTTEEPEMKTRTEQRQQEKKEGGKQKAPRPAKGPPPPLLPNSRLLSPDRSIMEMQRTYPDLAFRGRPLVAGKPQQAKSSRKPLSPPEALKCSSATSASENHGSQPENLLDDDDDDDVTLESGVMCDEEPSPSMLMRMRASELGGRPRSSRPAPAFKVEQKPPTTWTPPTMTQHPAADSVICEGGASTQGGDTGEAAQSDVIFEL